MRMELTKTQYAVIKCLAIAGAVIIVFYLSLPANNKKLTSPIYNTTLLIKQKNTIKPVIYEDITLKAGINKTHIQRSEKLSGIHDALGAGACLFDFDNDGLVDILTLNGSGTNHFFGKPEWWQHSSHSLTLYKNINGHFFEDVTEKSGLIINSETMGCNSADLDNDGDHDILITNRGTNQLWRNNGDNTFTDITQQANPANNKWSTSSTFSDVNRDGLLDIYVTNYIDYTPNSNVFEENAGFDREREKKFESRLYSGQKNDLYINQGDMNFIEYAEQFGINNPQGRGLSATWADLNNDLWPDLLIANDNDSENKIYLNQQGKYFKDISTSSNLALTHGNPTIAAIKDNQTNSWLVLKPTKPNDYTRLFQLDSNIVAKDISAQTGLDRLSLAKSNWGAIIEDINADGEQDIVIANGSIYPDSEAMSTTSGQPNTLLIGSSFAEHSNALSQNTYPSASSRCITSADFNNDGMSDLFITQNNDLPQLLINKSTKKSWLGIELKDNQHRPVYGAKIQLLDSSNDTVKQTRIVGQHQGFLCSGDSRMRFAINYKTKPRLKITWPDGTIQTLNDITLNQYNAVTKKGIKPTNSVTANKTTQSSISLDDETSKLIVIKWLIDNKHLKQASVELNLLAKTNNQNIRRQAYQLAYTLPNHLSQGFIQTAIYDESEAIRIEAIDAIRQSENENLSRWLLQSLKDTSPKVACKAAYTYETFFHEEEALTIRKYLSIKPLIQLSESSNQDVQICAIKALGASEHYRAIKSLLNKIKSNNERVRIEAAKALALIKEKSVLAPLLELFHSKDTEPSLKATVFKSIIRIEPTTQKNSLINTLLNREESNSTISSNLQTLLLILSDNTNKTQLKESEHVPLLFKLKEAHHSNFSENDHITFLKIMWLANKQFNNKHIERIKTLQLSSNPDVREQAVLLRLMLSPSVNTNTNLLINALKDNDIAKNLVTKLSNKIRIHEQRYISQIKEIDNPVYWEAYWKLHPSLESQEIVDAIINTLSNDAITTETKQTVITYIQNRLALQSELCENSKRSTHVLNNELLEVLNGCLLNNKITPAITNELAVALKSSDSQQQRIALTILANRPERWARNIIKKSLFNKERSNADNIAILESLPNVLTKSIIQSLKMEFHKNPIDPIAAQIAKTLMQRNDSSLKKISLESLSTLIANKNESDALLYAKALIDIMPNEVLENLISVSE